MPRGQGGGTVCVAMQERNHKSSARSIANGPTGPAALPHTHPELLKDARAEGKEWRRMDIRSIMNDDALPERQKEDIMATQQLGIGSSSLTRRGLPTNTSAKTPGQNSSVRSYALQSDWDVHRQTIERLYRDERRTLSVVMAVMETEHNFIATAKMYKLQIKKWKLEKNYKEHEVLKMVRLMRKPEAIGKASCFVIRNRVIDWNDVLRYLSRRPDLLRHIEKQNNNMDDDGGDSDVTSAHDIICKNAAGRCFVQTHNRTKQNPHGDKNNQQGA
ncbi:Clr5 domain-containing protein [Diplogelasinospora grovesii]|uniref:Clr5 domain-containing protein n=1 Tax=Diplogelasinospora grovesii TaxID=303347 RepID=A0AAN6S8J3_9PEZI|nr:Clr5 domain-containing protein [Diplogelasinospora grovesii]